LAAAAARAAGFCTVDATNACAKRHRG
jgi:hypothetical protein